MKLILIILTISFAFPSLAHSGGTDSSGCHTDHIHGGYHCHKSDTITPKTLVRSPSSLKETKKTKRSK